MSSSLSLVSAFLCVLFSFFSVFWCHRCSIIYLLFLSTPRLEVLPRTLISRIKIDKDAIRFFSCCKCVSFSLCSFACVRLRVFFFHQKITSRNRNDSIVSSLCALFNLHFYPNHVSWLYFLKWKLTNIRARAHIHKTMKMGRLESLRAFCDSNISQETEENISQIIKFPNKAGFKWFDH